MSVFFSSLSVKLILFYVSTGSVFPPMICVVRIYSETQIIKLNKIYNGSVLQHFRRRIKNKINFFSEDASNLLISLKNWIDLERIRFGLCEFLVKHPSMCVLGSNHWQTEITIIKKKKNNNLGDSN